MRRGNTQRDAEIVRAYESRQFTTQHIARTFGLSRQHVLRIVRRAGVSRTQAEGNRVATPLKSRRRLRRPLA